MLTAAVSKSTPITLKGVTGEVATIEYNKLESSSIVEILPKVVTHSKYPGKIIRNEESR